jgi:hypothetical protein
MVLFLCLKPDGEVREVDKNLSNKFQLEETIGLQYLKGVIDIKGKGKIERLTIWDFNNYKIYIYGWTKGSEDILTNHSLPSPLNNCKIYGDLLCFLTSNNEIIDFTEGFYLDFFQNNWEDNPEEDEEEEDAEELDEEDENESEDDEIDEEEHTNPLELLILTNEELQLESEYLGI